MSGAWAMPDIKAHRLNELCETPCQIKYAHEKAVEAIARHPNLYWEDVNYSLAWREQSRDKDIENKRQALDTFDVKLYSHLDSKPKLVDSKSAANFKMMERILTVNIGIEEKRMRVLYIPSTIQTPSEEAEVMELIWSSIPRVSVLEIPILPIQALWFLSARNIANQNSDLTKRQVAGIVKIISNPNCPSELLKFYCFDENEEVRNAAMDNPSCLEEDKVESALYQIRRNPTSGLPLINSDTNSNRIPRNCK